MKDLKVSVVQTSLHWENPSANYEHFDQIIGGMNSADIVVLPEMFTTGFSMNTSTIAEQHGVDMPTLKKMRQWAKQVDGVVCGSVSVRDNHFYNRLYWVRPDGSFSFYDKRHSFSFAQEDEHYERGENRLIEEWRGWKILPLICYDLRFPVWSRNAIHDGISEFDIMIYVANWSEARREPWMKLLPARAIENQVYVAACNRVGTDGKDISYSGDSMLLNSRGEILQQGGHGVEEIISAEFSRKELEDFRSKFPVLRDADHFELKK